MKRKMLAASLLLWMFSLTAQADCAVLGPGKIPARARCWDRPSASARDDRLYPRPGTGSVRLPTRRLQMKKVLLAVFLLCGFSLTAQAACPVFGPSEDPCSGPVFGPSTCKCP